MKRRRDELARRRQALQARSDQLRRDFGADAAIVEGSVERADRTLGLLRRLTPLLLAGAAAAALLLRRRLPPLSWLTRGLVALSVIRRGAALIRGIVPR